METTVIVAMLSLIFLAVAFYGTRKKEILTPGTLSNAHATSAASCQDCHSPHELSDFDFGNVASFHTRSIESSHACLDCHDVGEGEQDLMPHGLSSEQLAVLTSGATESSGSMLVEQALLLSHLSGQSELACATCHAEHRGARFDLTAMSNNQCQTCHTNRFHSFMDGHSEFSNYPFNRRTRIQFDHVSHTEKHFINPKFAELAPNSCQDCHVTDTRGELMQIRSFEVTCAQCHSEQIQGVGRASEKGIAVFRLPALDARSLAERGRDVGEWPEYAEGTITSFMELAMLQNETAAEALQVLQGKDLYDLSDADELTLDAAETLAWAIKELFVDLVVDGQSELAGLESEGDSSAKVAGLNQDTLIRAYEQWIPSLFEEVAMKQQGLWPPELSESSSLEDSLAEESQSGTDEGISGDNFQLDESSRGDGLLLSHSDGHSEGLLLSPDEDNDVGLLLVDSDSVDDTGLLLDSDGDTEGLLPESGSGDVSLLISESESNAEGSLLFEEEDVGDLLMSGAGLESEDGALSLLMGDSSNQTVRELQPIEVPEGSKWSAYGGWYRNDNNYSLHYHPTGHADRFMKVWLDISAKHYGEKQSARTTFEHLSSNGAPGDCMKCHSVDTRTPSHELFVNWRGKRNDPNMRTFTRFDHSAHFSLLSGDGCRSCHPLDSKSDYAKSFENNRDPQVFRSNFRKVEKAQCASCHQPKLAGNSCLQCHNYHIGTIRPLMNPDEL